MGSKSSKSVMENPSITTEFKKDTIIKTVLKTANFRFALQMKATKLESKRLNESWKDFINGIRDNFIFNNETKYPQYIKIMRMNNKIQFSTTTTVEMKEEDLDVLTKMFSKIEDEIQKYEVSSPSGLTITNNSSSSNLLISE
jgi:hypothetical protein